MDPVERRERLEEALSPVQHRALLDSCADLGIEPETWPEIDTLRRWVEAVAVARRVKRLRRSFDISETRAVEQAAGWFGLNPDTIRKALLRWRGADRERRQRGRRAA